jgi:hypothetical protein
MADSGIVNQKFTMMSLAHIHVAKTVMNSENPLLIYGSFFPDFFYPARFQEARRIHETPLEFQEFIAAKHPELMQLAIGVCLHCAESKGLDFYSHTQYKNHREGYSNIHNKKLSDFITTTLGTLEPGLYHVVYHGSREFAIDLLLKDQALVELLAESIKKLPVDNVSVAVAEYLNIDVNYVKEKITKFNKIFLEKPYDMNLMVFVTNDNCELFFNTILDEEKLNAVFNQAIDIVQEDYEEFLDYAIEKISQEFEA